MGSRRWLLFLLVTVAVEAALALTVRLNALSEFAQAGKHAQYVVTLIGLLWMPLLLVAVAGVARALLATHQQATREAGALVDVATTSHDWVWTADTEMRLTSSNERVTDLLGYLPAELYGRKLTALLPDAHKQEAMSLLATALRGRSGWDDVDYDWVHRDGHLVALQGSARPVLDAAGAIVGFRGTRRLVTTAMTEERSLHAVRRRIRDALDTDALDIALQPIVGIADGRMAGVEALARFRDGRPPDVWFAEAHDSGQNLELDLHAFRAALLLLPSLPPTAYLSVNATPQLIVDPAMQHALLDSDLLLDRLVLEITEHVAIDDYDALHIALEPLRTRGLRLAIDDTGAGYASLAHVLELRPDIIKIDRSLITAITSDPAKRSLVTALVLLALDLNAEITAEGVETPSELETIATLGVDCVQGYLLARPTTDPELWQTWWNRNWLQPTALMPTPRKRSSEVSR